MRERARPGTRFWLAAVLALAIVARPASAQVPEAPADTLPADTVPTGTIEIPIPPEEVGGDTIPTAIQEAAEAPTPILQIPEYSLAAPTDWAVARWVWTREELSRMPGMTLLELVERLPGLTRFRAGGFGRPTGLAALATGGSRMRVFLDGYELDPLGTGSYELETLALLDLQRIRIERTMSGIRVEAESYRLDTPEPHSEVALGTGVYQTRVLRALFSRGFGDRAVGTGSFDLASTGGIGIRETYRHSSAVLRWGYALSERSGFQIDWRRTAMDRSGFEYPHETSRTDLVLTGRTRLSERIVADARLGRALRSGHSVDAAPEDRLQTVQGAARVAYTAESAFAEVDLRARGSGDPAIPLPSLEFGGRGGMSFGRLVRLDGELSSATAPDLGSAALGRATATVMPFDGISLFGSLEAGDRFLPFVRAAVEPDSDPAVVLLEYEQLRVPAGGWRAGGEVAGRFGSIGAAAFASGPTSVAPFGLAFDTGSPLADGPAVTGVESSVRILVPRTAGRIRLDGAYSHIPRAGDRPYTPTDNGRASIVLSDAFFEGELQPQLRVEAVHRGRVFVPAAPGAPMDELMPAIQILNLALQIRIIDVEAFLLWDNMVGNRTAIDFPGVPLAVPRIIYGASWRFRN